MKFLGLSRSKSDVEGQHPTVIKQVRFRSNPLHRYRWAVLRLKNQSPAVGVPVNRIVGFPWRVDEPCCRFVSDPGTHVKTKCEILGRVCEVLDANQLCCCATPRRHERFGGELQTFGLGLTEKSMREPLVSEPVSARRMCQQDLSIQKHFAGNQESRAPRHVGNSAACERRKRQGRESRNRFCGLNVPEFVLCRRQVVQIPPCMDQSVSSQILDGGNRREMLARRSSGN